MAMGINNPGFQLLSLAEPSLVVSGTPSYADSPCFLQNQIAIYLNVYLPLFLISLCILAVSTLNKLTSRKRCGRAYNFDLDPNDVSLIQLSPEAEHTGILHSARLPGSAGLVNGGNAPTYRASSATFTATPNTPDFSVTDGRMATPNLLVAPPSGFVMAPGDAEQGYISQFDGEDDESYQENSYSREGTFYASPGQRRRLAWSWTIVLRNRRRRITIGVPLCLERVIFRIAQPVGRREVRRTTQKDRGKGRHSTRRDSAIVVFVDELWRAVWPVVLAFVALNLYMFI